MSVNIQYFFKAYAISTVGTTLSTPELNFWTLANAPTTPTVGNPTASSLDVTLGSGDGNPSTTSYAIHETTQDKYVQADGTLNTTAVYQTAATWGTKTVTLLTSGTLYTFEVKARNGANIDTAFSAQASGTTAAAATGKIVVTLPGQTFTDTVGNSGTVSTQTAGSSFNITLTATLADEVTIDTSYSGTKTISYSGPSTANGAPVYTTSVDFISGQSTTVIATTLKKAETTAITATDGSLTGLASSSLTVNPGAIDSYTVTSSSPQTAGAAFSVTVTANDSFNNTVTTDNSTVVTMTGTGSVQFDSNGDSTFGDNTKTLTTGTFTISTKDNVAEAITVTATDGNSKTGTSSSITITPGAIDHYVVTATSPQATGVAFVTTVTAKDANNNTVTTDSTTSVTMSGTGSVVFDSNGNGTFNDNAKTLTSGTFTISTRDNVEETITVTALDANTKTGVSGNIVINALKFRSKQTGNWSAIGTWEKSSDGGSIWVDATATPTSADGTIQIRNSHTVTVTASVAADQVAVDSGGQITVNSGQTLTIAAGPGTDLNVSGTVVSAGTITPTGTIVFESGGKYQHSQNAGSIPASTWNVNSTCEITGWTTSTGFTSFSQSFGNFTWNSPGTSGTLNMSAALQTITGNFRVQNTGSGAIRLFGAAGGTLNVSGDITIDSTATLSLINANPGGVINIGGNLSVSGTLSTLGSSGSIVFNKTGTQTFTSSGTTSGVINWTVGGSSTLDIGTSTVGGSGTFTVSSGGTVKGSGTVGGTMVVNSGGTVTPGASIGTLTITNTPTFSGANFMEIDSSASPNADKVVLSSGTLLLTYGGTLTVVNIGPALTGGEVFDLFDATSFSGTFTATNLPALGSGLNWTLGGLATTGSIKVNPAPIPGALTLATLKNTAANLLMNKLILIAQDDGVTLSVTAVEPTTPNGGTAAIVGPNIVYTPATDYIGSDTITYTLSDDEGGSSTGTVSVTVNEANVGSQIMDLEVVPGVSAKLTASGIPNTAYKIQKSDNSGTSWEELATVTSAGNGVILYTNLTSLPESRWYRLAQ